TPPATPPDPIPTGAGSLNGAPGDEAEWPGVGRPPDPAPPQFTPAEVPGCFVVGLWAGLAGGPAPHTTSADGSNRHAPIAREANTCFIVALPFKMILRLDRIGQCERTD